MQRVLIVDDNDAIRESLADALADEGYAPESAADGITALRVAHESPPQVILLDLMMPGLDGTTVAERLSQTRCPSHVIILSADRRGAERAQALGAAGFLAKPFDLDELVALIRRLVGPVT